MGSNGTGPLALDRYCIYKVAFSNMVLNASFSFLDGNPFLNSDQFNLSISINCLNEGMLRPISLAKKN